MNARFAYDEEITRWDELVLANPDAGNIFQATGFAEIKALSGWTPRYLRTDDCAILALERSVPLLGKVWYLPEGPGVASADQLGTTIHQLRDFAAQHGVISMKIEPPLLAGTELPSNDWIPTRYIQPDAATVTVNISGDIDEVFASFPQRGRRDTRAAERAGVIAERVPITDENIDIMYRLFAETSQAAGFAIRPPEYYRHFYSWYRDHQQGELFFASLEGEVLAGAFVLLFGQKAVYKDGGSAKGKKVTGVGHILQWRIMQWLNERGYTSYDLFATTPADQIADTNHPYYGITVFKRSFNKTVTEKIGAFEVPVKPLQAKVWTRYGERVVTKVHRKLKQETYY